MVLPALTAGASFSRNAAVGRVKVHSAAPSVVIVAVVAVVALLARAALRASLSTGSRAGSTDSRLLRQGKTQRHALRQRLDWAVACTTEGCPQTQRVGDCVQAQTNTVGCRQQGQG